MTSRWGKRKDHTITVVSTVWDSTPLHNNTIKSYDDLQRHDFHCVMLRVTIINIPHIMYRTSTFYFFGIITDLCNFLQVRNDIRVFHPGTGKSCGILDRNLTCVRFAFRDWRGFPCRQGCLQISFLSDAQTSPPWLKFLLGLLRSSIPILWSPYA
jgi:hypothetical protein